MMLHECSAARSHYVHRHNGVLIRAHVINLGPMKCIVILNRFAVQVYTQKAERSSLNFKELTWKSGSSFETVLKSSKLKQLNRIAVQMSIVIKKSRDTFLKVLIFSLYQFQHVSMTSPKSPHQCETVTAAASPLRQINARHAAASACAAACTDAACPQKPVASAAPVM